MQPLETLRFRASQAKYEDKSPVSKPRNLQKINMIFALLVSLKENVSLTLIPLL